MKYAKTGYNLSNIDTIQVFFIHTQNSFIKLGHIWVTKMIFTNLKR